MIDESKNPWQILSAKEIYSNAWIQLTEYDVINPSGGKGIYGKVHFKNLAVGVVPIDEKGNTWLVGQYRFTLDQYSWEMPEGGGPLGIDPLESAKRELLEEAGLVAGQWEFLMKMHLSNSVADELALIYIAREISEEMAMPEETEQLVVKKIPFEEAYRMVEDGTITDAMTVAAYQKVRLLQLEGKLRR